MRCLGRSCQTLQRLPGRFLLCSFLGRALGAPDELCQRWLGYSDLDRKGFLVLRAFLLYQRINWLRPASSLQSFL